MASLKGSRNNTFAGTLVIVSIFGMILVIILLAGGIDVLGKRSYTVSFDLQTGVEGLGEGSQVQLGGREIGSVSSVTFHSDTPDSLDAIHVKISVDKSFQFKDGTIAFLQKPLLGTTSIINFISLGDGDALTEIAIIPGRLAPPGFLSQAGYGEDQQVQVQHILARGERIAANFEEASERINQSFLPKAESIADDVKTVSSDVREKWPAWATRVDDVMDNVRDLSDDANVFITNMNERSDQVREVLTTAQAYMDDNREDVRAAIASAKDVSGKADTFLERLNGELTDLASGMLQSGSDAMDQANSAIDEAQSILVEQRPNIRETLANFRLTSDQARDTLVELRAAPWRLLYRPNVRELEYELLYNSARSYARAVGEVRILTDRLESILSKPAEDLTDADRSAIAAFIRDLDTTRESYEKVEDAFLDQLIEQDSE